MAPLRVHCSQWNGIQAYISPTTLHSSYRPLNGTTAGDSQSRKANSKACTVAISTQSLNHTSYSSRTLAIRNTFSNLSMDIRRCQNLRPISKLITRCDTQDSIHSRHLHLVKASIPMLRSQEADPPTLLQAVRHIPRHRCLVEVRIRDSTDLLPQGLQRRDRIQPTEASAVVVMDLRPTTDRAERTAASPRRTTVQRLPSAVG